MLPSFNNTWPLIKIAISDPFSAVTSCHQKALQKNINPKTSKKPFDLIIFFPHLQMHILLANHAYFQKNWIHSSGLFIHVFLFPPWRKAERWAGELACRFFALDNSRSSRCSVQIAQNLLRDSSFVRFLIVIKIKTCLLKHTTRVRTQDLVSSVFLKHMAVPLLLSNLVGAPDNHFSMTFSSKLLWKTVVKPGLHSNTLSWFLDQGRRKVYCANTHTHTHTYLSQHCSHIAVANVRCHSWLVSVLTFGKVFTNTVSLLMKPRASCLSQTHVPHGHLSVPVMTRLLPAEKYSYFNCPHC